MNPAPWQVGQRDVLLPKHAVQRAYCGSPKTLRLVGVRPVPPQDLQAERPEPWQR